ncbi:OmpA family protein [Membranihabitans marinus]|uniref:hypothetical protein n=1 Tax=Membranihabitans marinus TaxID=1227546 RepID=UPI001F1A4327|nr:hypothetical protein [Membranihabitans marinus]
MSFIKGIKFSVILLLMVVFSNSSYGQTRQAFINAAEKAFEEKNYYAALKYYTEVLEFKNASAELYYKTAESARYFFAYELAKDYYTSADMLKDEGDLPLTSYYVAEMAFQMGDYETAIRYFTKYLNQNKNDSNFYIQTAKNKLEAITWAQENNESAFVSTVERLSDSINTNQSEFAPIKLGDDLVFSALRYPDGDITAKPMGRVFNNRLDTLLQFRSEEDSLLYQSHFALNMDSTRLFYTLCKYITGEESRCAIHYSDLVNGEWQQPQLLVEIQDTAYNFTTPNYGVGPMGKGEGLYYATNKVGGKGGYDIYFTSYEDGLFLAPQNVYALNTPLDELAPFYHEQSKSLFFSTNGFSGYGGLDIFQMGLPLKSSSKIENLGSPINSSFDDVYFSWGKNTKDAYFASNRNESYKLDTSFQACCYDLYIADMTSKQMVIKVLVFNKLTGEPIIGSTLNVIRDNELLIDRTNNESHEYNLDLMRGTYDIKAMKGGFYPDSTTIDLAHFVGEDTIVRKLFLLPKELSLELLTFDDETKDPVNGPTISISDLANPDKENIYQLNNRTNSLVVPIDRNFEYAIKVNKRGYEEENLVLRGSDYPDDAKLIKKIYLKRGNLESYLVLPLYFDNDFPDPRTWATRTNKNYQETFPPYFAKKNDFKEMYSQGLAGVEKDAAEVDVENFFDNEVLAGKQDLVRFLETLEEEVEKGEKITLVISGYASPKYLSNYNLNLSKRRINSLQKELEKYNNGVFTKYLRSNMLQINGRGYGSENAPNSVSGDSKDIKNSVYHPDASRERRVEIVDIIRN